MNTSNNTRKHLLISELPTPSFIVDLDILEKNILDIQKLCNQNKTELWPMIKTHKSSDIASMQMEAGAKGFLVGTVDSADTLSSQGFDHLCIAYPICGKSNIQRVIEIAKKCHLYISLDNESAAAEMEEMLLETDTTLDYMLSIDSGLHRLGVKPNQAANFVGKVKDFKHLSFKGISTHPGQVYGASTPQDIHQAVVDEYSAMKKARDVLTQAGYEVEMIATGSTPTLFESVKQNFFNIQRPGNYVFYDNIQIALDVASEEDCSFTVLATVISDVNKGQLILDAGSKCLGLDIGGHGIPLVNGYGRIKGHPELIIKSLSEEVAKVLIQGKTTVKVGDQLEIIPNHACSSANMTNYLIGYRNHRVEKLLYTDIRSGSRKPPL